MGNKNEISTEITVSPNQAKNILSTLLPLRRAIFLWGSPGIGKSSIVSQIAHEKGMGFVDLRLSQISLGDLIGIPYPAKEGDRVEGVRWAPPYFINQVREYSRTMNGVVLFLDEFNCAIPAVLASAYQLVLERRVGVHELPENCYIIAAGNHESDRGVTFKMPTPLLNRFIHLNVGINFSDWIEYAVSKDYHYLVTGYLQENKADLFSFDPKNADKAFSTPRSWEFVSDILHQYTKEKGSLQLSDSVDLHAIISGCVGSGIATKFISYLRQWEKLPKVDDILSGKITQYKFEDLSVIFSLIYNLAYELRQIANSKAKNYDEICDRVVLFMHNNMPPEFVMVGLRVIILTYKLKINIKGEAWKKVSERYKDLFQQM